MSFLMGADVSSLQAMEDCGAEFFDLDGTKKDALKILKNHGVNYIRLRLFNSPTMSFDGGDYCDLKHTIEMAKRIKALNMGFMLDFHYSDFWADWQTQRIPKEWKHQNASELAQSVYDFTFYVMKELIRLHLQPDIVQIGNEIGNGLLWDYGRLEHPGQIVSFLNAGLRAVHDTAEKDAETKTLLHIESGGDVKKTERFFRLVENSGIEDFDYVGLSYYPYWAGDYGLLEKNICNIGEKFGKEVIVVETAFPYTDESHDDTPNVVDRCLTMQTMELEPSVQNQRTVTESVIKTVRDTKYGRGVFYWEPVWYQVKGVGVERNQGNEWENQAMFDHNGRALDSLNAFGLNKQKLV